LVGIIYRSLQIYYKDHKRNKCYNLCDANTVNLSPENQWHIYCFLKQHKLLNLNKFIMTEMLTKSAFLEKVFNFEKNQEWKFEGSVPCIIDFYADWCNPCKMVAPILEELSDEYAGKLNIYKVNTEIEQELAGAFGIRSIPSMLFCPADAEPQMAVGALPKQQIEQIIADVLKVTK